MKKNVLTGSLMILAMLLLVTAAYSQAPKSFNYQGVARSSTGSPLANTAISIQASILETSASGTPIYTESQAITTTAQGYFAIQIGTGTVSLGTFAGISWNDGKTKWLQISIDPTGGTNYTLMGSSQLVSVPFSLYSASAGYAPTNLKAESPLSISNDSVLINPGTAVGDLISWDGDNWVATQPTQLADTSIIINNIQPYLSINYCIALDGVFPSRNGIQPYVGEIDIYGFNFAPTGWALCNGQLLSIQQNVALFSLLGTTYGGNGTSTFQLPDLQGRVPIGMGQGSGLSPYVQGQIGGTESNTITIHR